MAELNSQIAGVVGQPSSVRMGRIIHGLSPEGNTTFSVSVQGVVFDDVGWLGPTYFPRDGDVVVVLGQSPASGSDPASWVVLGNVSDTPALRHQAGDAFFNFGPATSSFLDVTFAFPFPIQPPIVVATIATGAGAASGWFIRVGNITTTGFRIFVNGPSATWTDLPVNWIAQEATQPSTF